MSTGSGLAILGIWGAIAATAFSPVPNLAAVLGFFALIATLAILAVGDMK